VYIDGTMWRRHRGLIVYLAVLTAACGGFIWAARALGQTANLVAAFYMLTPALAAAIARAFFHGPRFSDAALRPGPLRRYLWVWLGAVGLVVVQFAAFLASGAMSIDTSGQGFLDQIEQVMPGGAELMLKELPPGMTLQGMLALYALGGLTVFNVPGTVLGFGEEFGWRGFMFPQLYRIRPWVGFVVGGLIWFAWHVPLSLLAPARSIPSALLAIDAVALGIGSIATFAVFAWLFVRGGSIWVPSLFHAVMNNGSRALSYWVRIEHQVAADVLLSAVMVLAVVVLWRTGQLRIFEETKDRWLSG
jgi:membrane protease YdiL (CAAX protease family)